MGKIRRNDTFGAVNLHGMFHRFLKLMIAGLMIVVAIWQMTEGYIGNGIFLLLLSILPIILYFRNEFILLAFLRMRKQDFAGANQWLNKIKNAGAIFLGPYSPVAAGDFVAGPSHTLPTGGAGKSFSGLTIDQFFRRASLIEYSKASLKKVLATIKTFGEIENLDAHSFSAQIRFLRDQAKSKR